MANIPGIPSRPVLLEAPTDVLVLVSFPCEFQMLPLDSTIMPESLVRALLLAQHPNTTFTQLLQFTKERFLHFIRICNGYETNFPHDCE